MLRGAITLTERHKFSYISNKNIENVADITENEKSLLKFRTEATKGLQTCCLDYKSACLEMYKFLQKVCCDPLKKHKRTEKTKLLHPVTVQKCTELLKNGI